MIIITNRDKFNDIHNDILADILYWINDDNVTCKFCAYTKGDCFGKGCLDGIKSWLNSHRDKFNKKNDAEIADILSLTSARDKCKFCCNTRDKCQGESCFIGIQMWLDLPCEDEPENHPPADNMKCWMLRRSK